MSDQKFYPKYFSNALIDEVPLFSKNGGVLLCKMHLLKQNGVGGDFYTFDPADQKFSDIDSVFKIAESEKDIDVFLTLDGESLKFSSSSPIWTESIGGFKQAIIVLKDANESLFMFIDFGKVENPVAPFQIKQISDASINLSTSNVP